MTNLTIDEQIKNTELLVAKLYGEITAYDRMRNSDIDKNYLAIKEHLAAIREHGEEQDAAIVKLRKNKKIKGIAFDIICAEHGISAGSLGVYLDRAIEKVEAINNKLWLERMRNNG